MPGERVCILDGDKIRCGLCSDLAFSRQDRKENVRRISEVTKLFAEAGNVCIAALISPYRNYRLEARNILRRGRFIKDYVNAPIEICEQRDRKGLYTKARAGGIRNLLAYPRPMRRLKNQRLSCTPTS